MGEPAGKVVSVLAAGPLGPFADAYKERLTRRGYTPVTTARHVIHLGHLSRWLEVHGMGAADLTRERIGQFVAARQALVGHRGCSLQGLLPLLEILEERGKRLERSRHCLATHVHPGRGLRRLAERSEPFTIDGGWHQIAGTAPAGRHGRQSRALGQQQRG